MKVRTVRAEQSTRPNELHHIDATLSKYFHVDRECGDGDFILKLNRPEDLLKFKSVSGGLGVWLYGLKDDYSGFFAGRYAAGADITSEDYAQLMALVWQGQAGTSFRGVPTYVRKDYGPASMRLESAGFFDRLGVKIAEDSFGNSSTRYRSMEYAWRSVFWGFEACFLKRQDRWIYEIALSELNHQFTRFLNEYNAQPRHSMAQASRNQLWEEIYKDGGPTIVSETYFNNEV